MKWTIYDTIIYLKIEKSLPILAASLCVRSDSCVSSTSHLWRTLYRVHLNVVEICIWYTSPLANFASSTPQRFRSLYRAHLSYCSWSWIYVQCMQSVPIASKVLRSIPARGEVCPIQTSTTLRCTRYKVRQGWGVSDTNVITIQKLYGLVGIRFSKIFIHWDTMKWTIYDTIIYLKIEKSLPILAATYYCTIAKWVWCSYWKYVKG
jgi:hypothetical protein